MSTDAIFTRIFSPILYISFPEVSLSDPRAMSIIHFGLPFAER